MATFMNVTGGISRQGYVLIFGDARSNWFPQPIVLKQIQDRVKRVYWFNPEAVSEWNAGDSNMNIYRKYCDRVFSTTNLDELVKALADL